MYIPHSTSNSTQQDRRFLLVLTRRYSTIRLNSTYKRDTLLLQRLELFCLFRETVLHAIQLCLHQVLEVLINTT